MSIKGWPDQQKTGDQQYATVTPVRLQQYGIDVVGHVYYQEIGNDAVEAGSTTTSIVATGHAAWVGDIISFTSGALNTLEVRVLSTTANGIVLAETLPSVPADGVTFDILRAKTATCDAQGNLSVGVSLSAETDAGPTNANTLRVVVANDQATGPLATEATLADCEALLTSISGEDFATETTLAAAASDLASIAAEDFATQTTLAAMSAKLPATLGQKAKAASLAVALASDQDALPITDNGGSLTVDGTVAATQSGTWNVTNISGTVSLPTGASTSAAQTTAQTSLTSIDGKLTVSNIAYQAKGKISGASLTGSYATLLNPTSDLRIVYLLNSCDATILVSLDGGTTDTFELEAGESLSVDLATNGLKFDNAVNISAKHGGAAPTSGTIRASGIG